MIQDDIKIDEPKLPKQDDPWESEPPPSTTVEKGDTEESTTRENQQKND